MSNMTVGIAVLDEHGVVHWAPYSGKGGASSDAGKMIARQMTARSPPSLRLACEREPRVRQVKRVSTLTRSVTCMACVAGL